jgi:DNA-directed RNA polymerase specialized sigma24 family protein
MTQKIMTLIAKKHNNWIEIVQSFGCPKETSEDIVQEMYIKIQIKLQKGLDIMYKDDVNYYYIFKTLRTLFYDLKRKEKNITIISIDDVNINMTNTDVDYNKAYIKIQKELKKLFWYDRKVFELINAGQSVADLSRKSYIQYYSLYNTYTKVKNKLKKLL